MDVLYELHELQDVTWINKVLYCIVFGRSLQLTALFVKLKSVPNNSLILTSNYLKYLTYAKVIGMISSHSSILTSPTTSFALGVMCHEINTFQTEIFYMYVAIWWTLVYN